MILIVLAGLIFADPPPSYCPPYWQCNGPKETNHPACKCWDTK
jgi:hypothetical protein